MTNVTRQLTCIAFAIAAMAAAQPAFAGDIVADWATVKTPPAPELKPVTVDPKTTALLLLDFMKANCGVRPRCQASVPSVKKILDAARAHNMVVAYNLTGQTPKIEDMVDPSLAPRAGEHLIKNGRGANKWYNSDLEQALKDKGIRTVIITGTSAQGAVAGTTQGATERGFKAIVPVDGISADIPYAEQYTVWHLVNAPRIGTSVTLTTLDDVKF